VDGEEVFWLLIAFFCIAFGRCFECMLMSGFWRLVHNVQMDDAMIYTQI